MKKTSYLLTSPVQTQRVSFTACIKNHAQRLADSLTEWISAYTGDELSKEEIKHGIHVVVALMATVLPTHMPLPVRGLLVLWLGISIYQCRHIKD